MLHFVILFMTANLCNSCNKLNKILQLYENFYPQNITGKILCNITKTFLPKMLLEKKNLTNVKPDLGPTLLIQPVSSVLPLKYDQFCPYNTISFMPII